MRVEGLDRVELGHSAETILLMLAWSAGDDQHRSNVVLRVRPPEPGLLEPYDLEQQFRILRALEPTPVRSPKVLWYEGTGDVLGRPFYVMERVGGAVYEQNVPDELAGSPDRLRRMSRSLVENLAALHRVDPNAPGLGFLGDGRGYLQRELDWWTSEMRRVQRGPLPALERLCRELQAQLPEQCPTVTLVHGDAKPGNFAFENDAVSAVFDWEMTSVGDPLTDLGWAEFNWATPGSFTVLPGSLTADEMVARYQELTRASPSNTGTGTSPSSCTRCSRSCSSPPCCSTAARPTTCDSPKWVERSRPTRAWRWPASVSTSRSSPVRSWRGRNACTR